MKELEQKLKEQAREIVKSQLGVINNPVAAQLQKFGELVAFEALQLKQNELDRLKSEKDTLYNALIGALDAAESGENPDTVAMSLALAKVNAETKYYISGFCVDNEGMTVDFMIDGCDKLHNVRVVHDGSENRDHWVSIRWITDLIGMYIEGLKND